MVKKVLATIFILSLTFGAEILKVESVDFGTQVVVDITPPDEVEILDENFTQDKSRDIKNDKFDEVAYRFVEGTSKRDRYIIFDKFIKKEALISDINSAMSKKFKFDDSSEFGLFYELEKFSIEKNHGIFWVDFLVEFRVKNLDEVMKTDKISKRYRVEFFKIDEIYKEALLILADEIYRSLHLKNNNQIKNKDGVFRLDGGGVVLPF